MNVTKIGQFNAEKNRSKEFFRSFRSNWYTMHNQITSYLSNWNRIFSSFVIWRVNIIWFFIFYQFLQQQCFMFSISNLNQTDRIKHQQKLIIKRAITSCNILHCKSTADGLGVNDICKGICSDFISTTCKNIT